MSEMAEATSEVENAGAESAYSEHAGENEFETEPGTDGMTDQAEFYDEDFTAEDTDIHLSEYEEGAEECDEEDEVCLDAESRRRLMMEYKNIISQIDAQNKIVDALKIQVCSMSMKQCRSREEERELRNVRCCLERENLKLQCLLKRVMELQEEDPSRVWAPIPIATTVDEDNMELSLAHQGTSRGVCGAGSKPVCGKSPKPCGDSKHDSAEEQALKENLKKFICCMMKQMKKKNQTCDEDTLKKILCSIKQQPKPERKPKGEGIKKICKELHRSYSMQSRLAEDNAGLENQRYRLQEEVLCRDKVIEGLQQKINSMQCELQQLCRERNRIQSDRPQQQPCPQKPNNASGTECFERAIDDMQSSVERLKVEMDCLRKERDQWECTIKHNKAEDYAEQDTAFDRKPRRKTKSAEIDELRKNYTHLMAEYAKKDAEMKEFKGRVKGSCCGGGGMNTSGNADVDQAELQVLREKVSDLQEEQEEFKCLMEEQSCQLTEYQNKYLAAQQKVEEQKCILDKLEMNNKKIEDQINLEIQRIKEKFQEKLKELAQLPKLLENEQLKLAKCCKEKEDLENKLRIVCKELKSLKPQISNSGEPRQDYLTRIQQLEFEVAELQKCNEDLQKDKDMLSCELAKIQTDLDTLRTESARIIARTKERAEQQREAFQERVDQLEKELAQCRATACLSITDREEVIKEMQEQLSTISYSFDSAQKQIKSLKHHIQFLSSGDGQD